MVLSHPFYCPTRIVWGHGFDFALCELIEGRSWVLVTSRGWAKRGAINKISAACGAPDKIIDDVDENPTIETVISLVEKLAAEDLLVALGGGSVIDAVKGAAVLEALGGDLTPFLRHLQEGADLPADLAPKPIIAIPTTAGTGSEVTKWGTIWGGVDIKYSVNHSALFPTHAIMDPALTITMPATLTIATGLDAVSHAMESVWNRRHGALTDAMASNAIALLHDNLAGAVERPDDIGRRTLLQSAAVLAGLSMSTTQTAVAHSISYPFSARYGMPHGLACSFTLPEVARFNMETDPARLSPIAEGFGCAVEELPEFLYSWFASLGVGELVLGYVEPNVTDELGDNVINRARAANNIRDVDGPAARNIARRALDRFFSSRKDAPA